MSAKDFFAAIALILFVMFVGSVIIALGL
jgi:hypothetical protein